MIAEIKECPPIGDRTGGVEKIIATGNIPHKAGVCNLSEDEREAYEERAAIMEYEGGLPRTDAERAAMRLILSRRTRQGTDALEAAIAAGIPLKPFYAKSADSDPASYSLALPLQHGERYKAYLWDWLVLDVDRNHRDGADGLKTLTAYLASQRKNGQALPSYLEAVLQSGSVSGFPCYAETPGGGWHLYLRHTGAKVSGSLGAGVEYKAQSITAAGSYKDGKPYILHGDYSLAPPVPYFFLPKPKQACAEALPARPIGEGGDTPPAKKGTLADCIAQSKRKHAGEALHFIVLRATLNALYGGFSRTEILAAMRQDADLSKHTQLASTVRSAKAGAA